MKQYVFGIVLIAIFSTNLKIHRVFATQLECANSENYAVHQQSGNVHCATAEGTADLAENSGRSTEEQLNVIISQRVAAEIEIVRRKFQRRMKRVKDRLERALIRPCEVYYKEFCYWTEYHAQGSVEIKKAHSICQRRNSELAYPVDATHYGLLMENIRSRITSRRSFWTGLRRNYTTDEVFDSHGRKVSFLKPMQEHQPFESLDTGVTLTVDKDPTSPMQGTNGGSLLSDNTFGVICRYGLP